MDIGGVDAARLANDNTREDVKQMREQVSVMWKQIKALEAKVRGITGEPSPNFSRHRDDPRD